MSSVYMRPPFSVTEKYSLHLSSREYKQLLSTNRFCPLLFIFCVSPVLPSDGPNKTLCTMIVNALRGSQSHLQSSCWGSTGASRSQSHLSFSAPRHDRYIFGRAASDPSAMFSTMVSRHEIKIYANQPACPLWAYDLWAGVPISRLLTWVNAHLAYCHNSV